MRKHCFLYDRYIRTVSIIKSNQINIFIVTNTKHLIEAKNNKKRKKAWIKRCWPYFENINSLSGPEVQAQAVPQSEAIMTKCCHPRVLDHTCGIAKRPVPQDHRVSTVKVSQINEKAQDCKTFKNCGVTIQKYFTSYKSIDWRMKERQQIQYPPTVHQSSSYPNFQHKSQLMKCWKWFHDSTSNLSGNPFIIFVHT